MPHLSVYGTLRNTAGSTLLPKCSAARVSVRCVLLPHAGGGEILAVLFEFCSVCYCNSPEGLCWPSSHHHMVMLALTSRVLTSQQEILSECSSDKGDNSRKRNWYVRASTCFQHLFHGGYRNLRLKSIFFVLCHKSGNWIIWMIDYLAVWS